MAGVRSGREGGSRVSRDGKGLLATVGYQGRSVGDLCAMLSDATIRTLVDVRYRAWSHIPAFRKGALSEALARSGIVYIHLPMAGNVPLFKQVPRPTYRECMRLYARHLANHPQVVLQLGQLAEGGRIALFCYEADVTACHRDHLCKSIMNRFPSLDCVHM